MTGLGMVSLKWTYLVWLGMASKGSALLVSKFVSSQNRTAIFYRLSHNQKRKVSRPDPQLSQNGRFSYSATAVLENFGLS